MPVAFAMVSAIVPSLLLLWCFHSRDTFRGPPRVVWASFGLGAFAIRVVPSILEPAPFALHVRFLNRPRVAVAA